MKTKSVIAGFILFLAQSVLASYTNVIKFYLHPNLVTNISFIRTNLTKYVTDMNYILAKNTGRVLSYSTNSGVIVTNQQPHNNQEVPGGNPNTGYEIWVHATQTQASVSFGGYMSSDSTTGAGVLAGFNWTRVYNPDLLTNGSSAFIDYKTQIASMLHELGHVFGAGTGTGTGEYYINGMVDDTTGVPPVVNIRVLSNPFTGEFNYQDPFWGLHSDFAMDPMLRPAPVINRVDMLNQTRYSGLSSSIMFQNYRYSFFSPPPMVSLTGLHLLVTDELTCLPLEGVTVKIWRIGQNVSLAMLVSTITGTNGEVIWNWNSATEFISGDQLRLIKASRAGYATNAFYLSSFDLQAMAVMDGQTVGTTRLVMGRPALRLSIPSKGVLRVTNTVPGKTFQIQASTNFVNWVSLVTNTPTTQAVFSYTNVTSLPRRFYRTFEAALESCSPIEGNQASTATRSSKRKVAPPLLPYYIPPKK